MTNKLIYGLIFVFISLQVQAQDNCRLPEIISEGSVEGAYWSITVLDSSGDLKCSMNSEGLITPASNLKLYTLGTILHELGANYTFKTHIKGYGELRDSVWKGDLVIFGSGDPSISGDLYGDDRYFAFKNLRDQLKEAGISKVDGAVLGYNGLFDGDKYPKGWDWDDLSFYYGVEIDALSFNNNAIDIEVYADGKVGQKPRMVVFPEQLNDIQLINEQRIAESDTEYDEYYRRNLGHNTIYLRSTLPEGYLEKESLSIHNGAFFFVSSFVDYLESSGIDVSEPSSEEHVINGLLKQEAMTELATHESRELADLINWAMKESDNFYTEMLLKTLVAEKMNIPATFEDGIQEVRSFANEMGADSSFIKMKDGSGMASGTLTRTMDLATFLKNIKETEVFREFYHSLSVAGKDGTLSYRFRNSDVREKFYGKSGFMSGVRTLSGYLRTQSGDELIISIATNHFIGKVRYVDDVHEDILEHLYRTH